MTLEFLKIVCPDSREQIGEFINGKLNLDNQSSHVTSSIDSIQGVPVLLNRKIEEKLNYIEESKSLPKQNSQELEIPFVQEALNSSEFVLQLGAGVDICNNPKLVKTDAYLYSTDLHCLADAHTLPFEDNSFGYVYSLAVFEHLHSPWIAAEEIFRVLKPGGKVYTLTAFMQHMHGYPHHYFNMTVSGLKRIFRSFDIEYCSPSRFSNITEIAYILTDLNFLVRKNLFDNHELTEKVLKVDEAVRSFCKNAPDLNSALMSSCENDEIEFSKISPAVEIVASKPS